jgi:hypothetical protein
MYKKDELEPDDRRVRKVKKRRKGGEREARELETRDSEER